jgi:hypothetical protein
MTGEQIFIMALLYLLGFAGSLLLLYEMQREAFWPSWPAWMIVAVAWPFNALLLPVSVGLLALCIVVSGEWKETRK